MSLSAVVGLRRAAYDLPQMLPFSLTAKCQLATFHLATIEQLADTVVTAVALDVCASSFHQLLDHQCLLAMWRSLALCDGSIAGLSQVVKVLY